MALTMLDQLEVAYPTTLPAALETLRRGVLSAVIDGSNATVEERARRVITWARRGRLRPLLPGQAYDDARYDVRPTTAIAADLVLLVPSIGALFQAVQFVGLSSETVNLLRSYLENTLPQRRIEGYCALACVCALQYSHRG